ncbi:MAG: TlpA family protein disulfide reductase [Xanthobacteraceae bacterium]|nr:MAG: TlpA family protein disulfide reductase [Xanthobacteraceae bacterium]
MRLSRRLFVAAMPLLMARPGWAAAGATAIVRHDSPRPLPQLAFDARGGETVTLDSLRGRLTVLHLWASWCASCRTEFPSLLKFQDTFAARHVALVTVSIDRLGWPIIDRTLNELSAHALPVFLDRERQVPAAVGAFGLPTSLIIDAEGGEIARAPGPLDWDAPEVTALIEALL